MANTLQHLLGGMIPFFCPMSGVGGTRALALLIIYIYIYLFFWSGSFPAARFRLGSCQRLTNVVKGLGLARAAKLCGENHGAVLHPRSDVALATLDHIACSHHLMRRVTTPKVTGKWTVVTNFTQEAGEDLLSSSGKHVAATLCAT